MEILSAPKSENARARRFKKKINGNCEEIKEMGGARRIAKPRKFV